MAHRLWHKRKGNDCKQALHQWIDRERNLTCRSTRHRIATLTGAGAVNPKSR